MKSNVVGIAAIVCVFAYGCMPERNVQVQLVDVQLVKIDTIYRQGEGQKVLTWQASDRMEYLSYEDLKMYLPIGTRMRMMVRR